jgi:N-methylhydantoinase B
MNMAVTEDIKWDGVTYPYIPGDTLNIDPSLTLSQVCDDSVDPVTHEVLRHALWNVNLEHGNTVLRMSGSPIAAYAHDFNPAILDAEGNFIFFGPFLQYLAAATSAAVKWTLEYRSDNPGIRPGDMFLFNDPWVASTHQSDVGIIAPVFVDNELFCWVGNTLHQWDTGGTAPGGFNPIAQDVFWESPCIPPVRIVEAGYLRKDIEEHYTRTSRMRELIALDLRAEITGCRIAVDRIGGLIERYGAGALKATMRKLQDDSEAAFVRRLQTIPDGQWTEEGWMEMKEPGDRGLYRNRVTLTKKGDTLIFSNLGSAKQAGTLNSVFGAWKGAVVSMLNTTMLFDQMFCIEGALRHCEFEVEPGTITCATHPAAVSGAPALTLLQSIGLGGLVISKMLASSTDAELRTEVQSCMGVMAYPINAIQGIDQRGNPYSSFLLDPCGAALAAHAWRDGQDTGGWPWDLQSTMPNVEENELFYPLLFLWRRELPGSGGAGKFRGGNGAEAAFIPHKTDRVNYLTITSEVAVPGPGLFGGYPTSTNSYLRITGANMREQLERTHTMPENTGEVEHGDHYWIPAKSFDQVPVPEDVIVYAWAGAGGYGDPIERDPEMVREDVVAQRVPRDWAQEAYGVVLSGEGSAITVDATATEARRQAIIDERLAEAKPWSGDPGAQPAASGGGSLPADQRLTEYLEIRDGQIMAGDIALGPADRNWKEGALVRELPLTAANPHLRDASLHTDHAVGFRQLICPETGRMLGTEVVIDGAPPEWDIRPGYTIVREES